MHNFHGCSRHSLDDKARLILPKRFVERVAAVDQQFTMTAGPDGCLMLLDRVSWEAMAKRFAQAPMGNLQVRTTRRLFLGHAEEIAPDKAGRIVLPDALRRYAKIEPGAEVVLVGAGDWIEVWSAKRWDELMDGSQPELLFDWDGIHLADADAVRT
jgi:MraZ protein